MEELWRRDGLEVALGGRDENRLVPVLEYCIYALPHPHLSKTAIHISALLLDIYSKVIGVSPKIDSLFEQMAACVDNMAMRSKTLLKLQGCVDMILHAQSMHSNPLPKNSSAYKKLARDQATMQDHTHVADKFHESAQQKLNSPSPPFAAEPQL
ncbi:kDa Trp-Asp repeats containing protein [Reticulomyxa filosa]|uniref:KDa Trp-Asp repeats containing protein n=1 Tax=Reticulomyxa filosa TaxID=46433 RepID=X6NZY0_RETFI|nr:kDa Trp-Asp repeats containing protein [Reticulomyxa filosa]|eukprot:ETO30852.1 kDa Trp-Asp repeats containing protein [Reticulomyxa filosa]